VLVFALEEAGVGDKTCTHTMLWEKEDGRGRGHGRGGMDDIRHRYSILIDKTGGPRYRP
jgi:hypothetical protein